MRDGGEDQQRISWPASFVFARAYLDQLERGRGLAAAPVHAARTTLTNAERATCQRRRSALTALGAELDRDAASAADGARVRALAGVVGELAR